MHLPRIIFKNIIRYRNHTLFTTIKKSESLVLTNWLSFLLNGPNGSENIKLVTTFPFLMSVLHRFLTRNLGSWESLETLIGLLDKNLIAECKFGFYSRYATCLPTVFPERDNQSAWGYSLAIVLLNFSAFLFIAFGYTLTFRYDSKLLAPSKTLEWSIS